jgi:hypothetical protein
VSGGARTFSREARARDKRLVRAESARHAVAGFGHGSELFVLTFGQFSLLDLVTALLDVTGPADVTVSTWTAATADLSRAETFLRDGRIRSLRFLVDRSFLTRQPGYARQLVDAFGVDAVRTTRTHAKFATITNSGWSVSVRTSMNLNENPRLEYAEVTDDPDLAGWLDGIVDEIWATEPAGLAGPRNLPNVTAGQPTRHGVSMGTVTGLGTVTVTTGSGTPPAGA